MQELFTEPVGRWERERCVVEMGKEQKVEGSCRRTAKRKQPVSPCVCVCRCSVVPLTREAMEGENEPALQTPSIDQ